MKVKKYDNVEVGKIYSSNNCGEFEVLAIMEKNKVEVRFLKTGWTYFYRKDHVCYGSLKDPYYPSIYGIGYLGKMYFENHRLKERALSIWHAIIARCYSKNNEAYKYYGEKGVTVSDEWLDFTNFFNDIKYLQNYDKWLKGELYHLDKDKMQKNIENKIYSKDTCVFVTQEENVKYLKLKYKKVYGYVNGIIEFEADAISDIANKLNLSISDIQYTCKHEKNYCGSYKGFPIIWRLDDDVEGINFIPTRNIYFKRIYGFVDGIKIFDFYTTNEIERELNILHSNVSSCLNKISRYAGLHNGKPIVWRFEDDTEDVLYKTHKTLINGYVNNELIFKNLTVEEARIASNLKDHRGIYGCIKNKNKYAGKYNGVPIVWKYMEE